MPLPPIEQSDSKSYEQQLREHNQKLAIYQSIHGVSKVPKKIWRELRSTAPTPPTGESQGSFTASYQDTTSGNYSPTPLAEDASSSVTPHNYDASSEASPSSSEASTIRLCTSQPAIPSESGSSPFIAKKAELTAPHCLPPGLSRHELFQTWKESLRHGSRASKASRRIQSAIVECFEEDAIVEDTLQGLGDSLARIKKLDIMEDSIQLAIWSKDVRQGLEEVVHSKDTIRMYASNVMKEMNSSTNRA